MQILNTKDIEQVVQNVLRSMIYDGNIVDCDVKQQINQRFFKVFIRKILMLSTPYESTEVDRCT